MVARRPAGHRRAPLRRQPDHGAAHRPGRRPAVHRRAPLRRVVRRVQPALTARRPLFIGGLHCGCQPGVCTVSRFGGHPAGHRRAPLRPGHLPDRRRHSGPSSRRSSAGSIAAPPPAWCSTAWAANLARFLSRARSARVISAHDRHGARARHAPHRAMAALRSFWALPSVHQSDGHLPDAHSPRVSAAGWRERGRGSRARSPVCMNPAVMAPSHGSQPAGCAGQRPRRTCGQSTSRASRRLWGPVSETPIRAGHHAPMRKHRCPRGVEAFSYPASPLNGPPVLLLAG